MRHRTVQEAWLVFNPRVYVALSSTPLPVAETITGRQIAKSRPSGDRRQGSLLAITAAALKKTVNRITTRSCPGMVGTDLEGVACYVGSDFSARGSYSKTLLAKPPMQKEHPASSLHAHLVIVIHLAPCRAAQRLHLLLGRRSFSTLAS